MWKNAVWCHIVCVVPNVSLPSSFAGVKMSNCNFCGKSVRTLREYVLHCKLKLNVYHRHNVVSANDIKTVRVAVTTSKCKVASCEHQCQDSQELIVHLKAHIVEGRAANGPVRECKAQFRVKASFTTPCHGGFYGCSVPASDPSTSHHL